jgi:acyl-coenzyme A synthetase/AMP-(fatty) acid ligase
VANTGVVGIPDDFAGEVPAVFIRLQPEAAAKMKGNVKAGNKLKREIAKVYGCPLSEIIA